MQDISALELFIYVRWCFERNIPTATITVSFEFVDVFCKLIYRALLHVLCAVQ